MKNPASYLVSSIEDIVFEDRNKAYGAYQLRKDTNRHIGAALFIGIAITGCMAAYMLHSRADDIVKNEIFRIIELNDVKMPDIPVPEVKAPAPVQPPVAETQTIEFVTMVPRNDAQVASNDLTKINDIKNKTISTVTNNDPKNNGTPILKEPAIKGNPVAAADQTVYKFTDTPPLFPGGFDAMQQWIANHIQYPKQAMDFGTEGIVYVSFVVNADGSVTDAKVERGIGSGCDEEAVRAVENMPEWIPGKMNKNAVRVKQTIPIRFELVH